MSIKVDCTACSDLQENNANVIVNGIGTKECTNLKNNEGMSGKGNDCDELEDLNDCLVGNMDAELEAYDICDWKEFMHKFIPNVFTVLKGIICAICGIWTNIDKIWCWLDNITKQKTITLSAYDDDGNPINGFRHAHGVDQATSGIDPVPLRISLLGNVARITGTLDFTVDGGTMPNSYWNGTSGASARHWKDFSASDSNITTTYGRESDDGVCPSGGLFVYEYQVKKCDFEFKKLFNTWLFANAADMQFQVMVYEKGDKYPYDCGWDANGNGQTYNPSDDDMVLIQVRLVNVRTWGIVKSHSKGNVTVAGITGALLCPNDFECE